MRRRWAWVIAASLALFLAACGGGSDGGGGGSSSGSSSALRIGFSPFTLDAPALQGLSHGLEAYAKEKGYTVLVADPKGDPAKQAQQMQGWITRKQVDAIWVIPTTPGALKTTIKSATDADVVVLASGKPGDYGYDGPGPGLSFNTFDYTDWGNKTGKLLSECINSRLGGQASVIQVTEPPSAGTGIVETANAIKSGVTAGSPNAKIVAEVSSGNDRLKAQQAVASALQAHRDANALFGTNDEGTLGGMTAFKQAGKDPKSVCIVGAGGGESSLAAVKAGDVYGVVAINFQGDLAQNVDLLAKMRGDPNAPGQVTNPPLNTVKGS